MKARAYKYGLQAEKTASDYYITNGFTLIEHRFKTPFGELDLIFQKENLLVFAEVKARKVLIHYELISNKQIQRNSQAANYYLGLNEGIFNHFDIRFDLIVIHNNNIHMHIENAW